MAGQKIQQKRVTEEAKVMAMLPHLLGIFTSFIGPLIIFLITKDQAKDQFAHENARHALNFHISMIIYYIIAAVLVIILIGVFLMWILSLFALIVGIIGSVRSYGGEVYKYPLEIMFFGTS